MGQRSSSPVQVQGTVDPGFESVKEMFERNFARGAEESAQLCVYVEDRKVVDLWCSLTNPSYSGDTLHNVFSSGKSLTAIAMASLVDRGLVSYGDKITQHWPEFGQNGKEELTVADLMRHEAGLAQFDTPLNVEDTLRENIKKNAIGAVIEKEECHWPKVGKRDYHSLSRGWIANEIFRRADPKQRTIGEYLSEDVAGPLNADVFVGVPSSRYDDYAPGREMAFTTAIMESMKTNMGGGALDIGFMDFMGILNMFRKFADGAQKPTFHPYENYDLKKIGLLFNQDVIRRGETSSANGNCSARGLARVAAAMANGGSSAGVEVLSPGAWEQLHRDPVEAPIFNIWPTFFTQGGVNKFEEEEGGGRGGYYGWFGYGGSVFQWDPKLKIGFAYTPSLLYWFDLTNNRGRLLQQEVTKCVKNMKK